MMNSKKWTLAALWCFGFAACFGQTPSSPADGNSIVFDFESGTFSGWRIAEGAFGKLITDREIFHNGGKPYNKQGKYFLSTLESVDNTANDGFTGVVISPVFKLDKPAMGLLVGGGDGSDVYVALCTVDGREHLKAKGNNTEIMRQVSWRAPELVGKQVYLKVVDHGRGGWGHITMDGFRAFGTIDQKATASMTKLLPKKALAATVEQVDFTPLIASVNDLIGKFPEYRTAGNGFLAKVTDYEKRFAALAAAGEVVKYAALKAEIDAFRLQVATANPLVAANPILFVARHQYKRDHHNTATMFQTGEINTRKFDPRSAYLKTIDFSRGGKVTTLLDPGATGLVRDPEVSYDGKRIIFSMRKDIADNYHIYEVNADGSGLRQLTSAKNVFDIDPLYLPDGNIVFTSSREPKFCMCNRHIMGNLFKMEADGANIHQIGKSTLFEGHSAMLPDGRIIYDRWEYVDRNFGDAQGLWVVNPDGTNHAIYWGNNTASPGGVLDARAIPGSDLVMCIFGSCHDRPWGAVAILDRKKGVDGRESVVRTWPADAINRVSTAGGGKWDSYMRQKVKYEDPFPLDKDYFLVARTTGKGEQTGIYLIDTFGNETLLHKEPNGCFDPMPIKQTPIPRIIPTRRDYQNNPGRFYVQNVYIGTHMQGVKPGSIKYLRVVESPEKRTWTNASWGGQGTIAPSMNWHDFSNKRIIGTVPVEEDGSAYFEAPSDTFLFFQVLDKDGKMIQSMRSGTMIQSGENQGCVGCHEDRVMETPAMTNIEALRREPSKMNGWYGKPRLFNYLAEVQPVFDKKCVSCHDYGRKAGQKLNLAADKTVFFNTSYMELWRKKYIRCIGGGPSQIQQAYSWGSHPSKLIKVLEKGHAEVKLSEEERDRLVTWVDMNGPYYPTYDSAYPQHSTGRSPLSNGQLGRLSKLTGAKFVGNHGGNRGPLVSFDRPELSPCLQKLAKDSPEYTEALAIIQAGQKSLQETPRADMPEFKPDAYAVNRLKFYEERKQRELEIRKAIREGRKIYDKGIAAQ